MALDGDYVQLYSSDKYYMWKEKNTHNAKSRQPPPKQSSRHPLPPATGTKTSVAGDNIIKVKKIWAEY